MSEAKITIDQIRARATETSFRRGETYYRQGAIFNTFRHEHFLEACCEGTHANAYRIVVDLQHGVVTSAICSCQYNYAGDCKHIVATLLTYLYKPEVFTEQRPLDEVLAERTPEQLIAIIKQMLNRYPDLQPMIERPQFSPHQRQSPLDTNSLRKELRIAISAADEDRYPWGQVSRPIIQSIRSISESANDFVTNGDWVNASYIYDVIIEEILRDPNIPMIDDDGELIAELNGVLQDMALCLPHLREHDQARQSIFEFMIDAYLWDIEFAGGVGLGDEVDKYIIRHILPQDISRIRERLEKSIQHESRNSPWSIEILEGFIMELDVYENVSPEKILQRLRQKKQYALLVAKLLEMQRVPEAVQIVQEHIKDPFERLRVLYNFTQVNLHGEAIQLAEESLAQHDNNQLRHWLIEQLKQRHDHAGLLRWLQKQMRLEPNLPNYIQLKQIGQSTDQWDDLRWDLIGWLEKHRHYVLLTQIYLQDQDWEQAWQTLGLVKKTDPTLGWSSREILEAEVAKQTAHIYPERAIPVYVRAVRSAIDQRNSHQYREAAKYLLIIRELHQKTDKMNEWQTLIDGIREEFKRLPAFQKALRTANL